MATSGDSTRFRTPRCSGDCSPLGTEPLLVTVETACFLLCLGRSKVYELIASGELPSLSIGTARRIPVAALQDWIMAAAKPAGAAGRVETDRTSDGR